MNKPWTGTDDDIWNFHLLTESKTAQLVTSPPIPCPESIYSDESATWGRRYRALEPIEKIVGDTDSLGATPEVRYATYLERIKATPYGTWLYANQGFKRALALFRKKKQSSKSTNYNAEWAELRFLNCCWLMSTGADGLAAGRKPHAPLSRTRAQAIRHIKDLRNDLDRGIQLDTSKETDEFRAMLEKLLSNLSVNVNRKPRADTNFAGRKFVEHVSTSLLREFGEASPGIVKSLAEGIGYDGDTSTINAQIAAVRRKRALVAKRTEQEVSKKSA